MIFRAMYQDYCRDVVIGAFERSEDGKRRIFRWGKPECVEHDSSDYQPSLTFRYEDAQGLVDALYELGLRPTGAKPQNETIAALGYHLEDMRRLVFKNK
jgi:hypothetical protein